MIEIVARDGPPEGMLCPAFICDACRKQVVREGNVIYAQRYDGNERVSSPLFVSHKGCTLRVDAMLARMYPEADGWMSGWDEIRDFIGQLQNNLRHAFADDREGTYLDQTISLPTGGIS